MLKTVALSAMMAVSVTFAHAADMPLKARPIAVASVIDWTGFYAGGNAGYAWADPSLNVSTANTFINTPVLTALGLTAAPAAAVASTANLGVRSRSFIGGVQAGYNFQSNGFVAGLETDIQGVGGTNGTNSVTQVAPRIGFPSNFVAATITASERLNYLGTVRGRLGFLATPSVLLYVTGGFAYGGVQSSTTIVGSELPVTGSTNFAGFGSASSTRVGYTVGTGAEWKFASQWSVKAEYLYYDLGTLTYSGSAMTSVLVGTNTINFTNVASTSLRFNGNLARIGLNYQFGGPITAKY